MSFNKSHFPQSKKLIKMCHQVHLNMQISSSSIVLKVYLKIAVCCHSKSIKECEEKRAHQTLSSLRINSLNSLSVKNKVGKYRIQGFR